jgi:hypothetical protein
MGPRAVPRCFSVQNEIEAARIRFITAVKQGQIEIASAVSALFQPAQVKNGAPTSEDAPGSLFTNLGTRGIVRAVCRLGDSGTTAR